MLRLRLLRQFTVEVDGVPVEAPSSRRAWELLAWLALHPGPHSRAKLAAQFWPDVVDASARANLRSALWALRRALGPVADGVLDVGHDQVALDPAAAIRVDTAEFDRLVAEDALAAAAELASGEFLTGLDADWVVEAREEHQARLGSVLERLALAAEADGDSAAALDWTRRQAALDPLAEEPQCRLLRRLAATGDRAAALAGYRRFEQRLAHELGLRPSSATRRLAATLADSAAGTGESGVPSPGYERMPPLVGRDRELDRLLTVWRAARAGRGGVVVISGEPGIGKTRLAQELVERARVDGARTAVCAALDLGGAAALGLWAELIGELCRDLDTPPPTAAWPSVLAPLAPDLERRLGREPGGRVGAAPGLERARLFEATVNLVEWAATRPVVLLLEDIHLADAASLDLAGYVGRRAVGMPVLVVLTRRPLPHRPRVDALEHALRARATLVGEVTLGPLPTAAIGALVRTLDVPDREIQHVVDAAEGNALLAVEYSRALLRGEREPPASLRGAVRAALAPLTADELLLAQFAAVAGRQLDRTDTAALPVRSPPDAAAGALESGLLVAARGRIGYRHALLREAVYCDLPDPHRAWLHETFAAALSTQDTAEHPRPRLAAETARHLRLAGQDELAVAQFARAAAHAREVAALAESASFLTEAIELAPDNGELLVELGEVQAWRGDLDASDDAFARAESALAARDPEVLARAWIRRANWYRGALCYPRRVLDSARRAVEVLDTADITTPDPRAEALAAWAWAEAVAGDVDRAEDLLRQVETAWNGRRANDLLTHWVEHTRAVTFVRRGRFAASYGPEITAAEAVRRAGRPDLGYGCWVNAACAAACAGDFDRALEFVDRGMADLDGSGLATLQVHFLAARAHVLMRMGRLAEARAASEQERRLADRLQHPALQATSEHDRGLVALRLGEYGHAATLLAAALEHDAPVSRPLARLALAEALVRLHRYDDAEREVRATALEPLQPSDLPEALVPRLTRLQGLIAAGRGQPELAERRLRESATGWRNLIDRTGAGDRYTAALADFGRPPVAGIVEPARELDHVLAELHDLRPATA